MSDAVSRWERTASVLLWVGILFLIFTAYAIYDGEDLPGIVMTIAPGAFVFALWYLVRARIEWLISGHKPALPVLVTMGVVAAAGALAVVLGMLTSAHDAERRFQADEAREHGFEDIQISPQAYQRLQRLPSAAELGLDDPGSDDPAPVEAGSAEPPAVDP